MSEEKKREGEKKKEEKLSRFIVSAPPHLRGPEDVSRIMLLVILALLPVTVEAVAMFGIFAVQTILLCIISSVVTEAVIQKIRGLPITIDDYSAVLTGLLLALCLPPKVPFWIPIIGGIVAIGLGKQVFGGLGFNIFNPALVGRAFLLMSWANHLTGDWYKTVRVDAVSGATPLFVAKQLRAGLVNVDLSQFYKPLLLANPYGSMGEVSALLITLGGLFLIVMGIIDWKIPAGYIGTTFLLSWLLGGDPIFYILAGGMLFGAFYMATDYVTTPITGKGRLFFGIGCGLVTVLIRFYSNFPEAVTYSILFMNACTPLIDIYIKPKKFGAVVK
jgi:electron transport complex protein RnfD